MVRPLVEERQKLRAGRLHRRDDERRLPRAIALVQIRAERVRLGVRLRVLGVRLRVDARLRRRLRDAPDAAVPGTGPDRRGGPRRRRRLEREAR